MLLFFQIYTVCQFWYTSSTDMTNMTIFLNSQNKCTLSIETAMSNGFMECIIPVHNELKKKHLTNRQTKNNITCKIIILDGDFYQYTRDEYILFHYFYALDIETTFYAINPLQNKHTHTHTNVYRANK